MSSYVGSVWHAPAMSMSHNNNEIDLSPLVGSHVPGSSNIFAEPAVVVVGSAALLGAGRFSVAGSSPLQASDAEGGVDALACDDPDVELAIEDAAQADAEANAARADTTDEAIAREQGDVAPAEICEEAVAAHPAHNLEQTVAHRKKSVWTGATEHKQQQQQQPADLELQPHRPSHSHHFAPPSSSHKLSVDDPPSSNGGYPVRGARTGSVYTHHDDRPDFQPCQTQGFDHTNAGTTVGGRSPQEQAMYSLESATENRWSVRFRWSVFIEEYIVHACGWIAWPYLVLRYNRNYADNHWMTNPFGKESYFGWWVHACFVTMNVLLLIYGANQVVTLSEILMASLVFLSRNSIIAAKYAFLSPFQVHDRHRRVIPMEELSTQMLIAGWLRLPTSVQHEELDNTFRRLALNDSEKSFATFSGCSRANIVRQIHANVPPESVENEHWRAEMAKGRLHARLVCRRIVADAVESVEGPYLARIAVAVSFVHVLIPTFCRAAQGFPMFGDSWSHTVMILCAMLISLPNFAAGVMFILVGALDYQRRLFMMHRVSGLLVDPFLIKDLRPSKNPVPLPLLNCSKANNVALWLELRLVFKDFGLQFFHRTQAYASFWVLTVAAMLAFLFFNILWKPSSGSGAVADTTGIVLVSYDFFTLLIPLLYMMAAAVTLNKQHVEQRKILLKKLCDMQRHVSLLTPTDPSSRAYAEAVDKARQMVAVAIQVVETEDELNPVSIMGFNADANLFRALVTAGGSGLAAAAKLLSDSNK